MYRMKNLSIGIRPADKMFRIEALGGVVTDKILQKRGATKLFDEEYFSGVTRNSEQGIFRLRSKDESNVFQLDFSNVLFRKDKFESEEKIVVNDCVKELMYFWKIADPILKIKDIRRIGVYAEFLCNVEKNKASEILLEKFTNLTSEGHAGKVRIGFEDREPAEDGGIPDDKKDSFNNIIYSYYDGVLDVDHPTEDSIITTIDVQRYYSPLFSGKLHEEILGMCRILEEKSNQQKDDFKSKGIG